MRTDPGALSTCRRASTAFREHDQTSFQQPDDVVAVDVDRRPLVEVQCRPVAEQHLGAARFGPQPVADDQRCVRFRGFASALAVEEHLPVNDGQVRGWGSAVLCEQRRRQFQARGTCQER